MRASAGILLYRHRGDQLEVLLAHPGGPLWATKDIGAWSIPKGEVEPGEAPLEVARREFTEETGQPLGEREFIALGEVKQRSGKVVRAWACEGDLDPATAVSNLFSLEWPQRSGRHQQFPEVDRVAWFAPEEARRKAHPGQAAFIDRLLQRAAGQAAKPGEPDS